MARRKRSRPPQKPQVKPEGRAETSVADVPAAIDTEDVATATDAVVIELTPRQRLLQLSYLLLFCSAVFLVNALEPDVKGETMVVGIATAIAGIGAFAAGRMRKE